MGCSPTPPPERIQLQVICPGMTPEESLELVLLPWDRELQSIPDLQNLYAIAAGGSVSILAEFEPGSEVDGRSACADATDRVMPQLPGSIEGSPLIWSAPPQHAGFSVTPSDEFGSPIHYEFLSELAHTIQQRPHVTRTQVSGVIPPRYEIKYNWDHLRAMNLTPYQLKTQLKTQLSPALIFGGIPLASDFEGVESLREIQLTSPTGTSFPLMQVADIVSAGGGAEDPTLWIWVENDFKAELAEPLKKIVMEELYRKGDYQFSQLAKEIPTHYVKVEFSGSTPERVKEQAKLLERQFSQSLPIIGLKQHPQPATEQEMQLDRDFLRVKGLSVAEVGQEIQAAYFESQVGSVTEKELDYPVILLPQYPNIPPKEIIQALQPTTNLSLEEMPNFFSWKKVDNSAILRKNGAYHMELILKPSLGATPKQLLKQTEALIADFRQQHPLSSEVEEQVIIQADLMQDNLTDFWENGL